MSGFTGEPVTKEEFEKRIDEVYRLLLTCNTRRTIIRYANQRGWNVAPRTIDKYIGCARKELNTLHKETREEAYAAAQNRLGDLYQQSYKTNDYRTCLQVLKESNDLAGLHTEQIQHTVTITDMDQLRKQVDEAISTDPNARDRITSALSKEDDEELDE